MTRVGIISGSGCSTWPGMGAAGPRDVSTRFGQVAVTAGRIGDVEVVHLSRHGSDHARLSNHVEHRANLAALIECRVDCLISLTICGAVHPTSELGSLVVFDDLYFPDNRLPDGSPCTWYAVAGEPGRGHWIFDRPFSEPMRRHALEAATEAGVPVVGSGCYGHVWGPRFNSRTEIGALARLGVVAVSQTVGPEIVLAGEAELPILVLGYLTDYANGVIQVAEPVEALIARMHSATDVFARVVQGVLVRVDAQNPPAAVGTVYRFQP